MNVGSGNGDERATATAASKKKEWHNGEQQTVNPC